MNDPFEIDAALSEMETDLDLLAFCYLTDDLSPTAKEAFELRLATEQPLREALARAVELSAALQQTSPGNRLAVVTPSHSSSATVVPCAFDHWMRITSFLAIGSAACLAVVIGIRAIPEANQLLSPETALAWSQVRDSWSEAPVVEELGSAATPDEASLAVGEREVEPLADEQGEAELDSELPDWLLMAVDGPGEDEVPRTE